jgi:hypothetical protein
MKNKKRKSFICRPTLIPNRKILRMRAKYNMLRDGVNLHDSIKHGQFSMHWREYAAR